MSLNELAKEFQSYRGGRKKVKGYPEYLRRAAVSKIEEVTAAEVAKAIGITPSCLHKWKTSLSKASLAEHENSHQFLEVDLPPRAMKALPSASASEIKLELPSGLKLCITDPSEAIVDKLLSYGIGGGL